MNDIKNKVFTGTLWRIGERFGAQSVTFAVSVILARLLEPSYYGEISLVLIITNILQVFIDSGFGSALIQKKNADDVDFSTIFFLNVQVCIVLYSLIFIVAPYISGFYGINELTNIIRIISIILLISGPKNILQAYISRNMMFRMFFWATLAGTVLSGLIAVVMAYFGMGIWSLVAQQVINPTVDTIVLWLLIRWRPLGKFSFNRLKGLFSFSWKILARDLLNVFFESLRGLIIGKYYSTADLAYYENGQKIPSSIYTNVDSAIRGVIFPVFSAEQDNKETVKAHMLQTIRICSYITFPMLFGMGACSKQIIILIWTEKWIEALPFFQIACAVWALNSIQALNQQVALALGRSDICLKNEILIKIITLISIVVSVRYGVMAIAFSRVVVTLIAFFINLWPSRKLLDCKISEQVRYASPEFILAATMAFIVYYLGTIPCGNILVLAIQICVGVGFYIGISFVFKMKSAVYIIDILRQYIKRKVN